MIEVGAVQLVASMKKALVWFINSTNLATSAQKFLPENKVHVLKSKLKAYTEVLNTQEFC